MSAHLSFPRAVDDPRSMPELRACLVDLARHDGPIVEQEWGKLLLDISGSTEGPVTDEKTGATIISGPNGYSAEELPKVLTAARRQAENSARWFRETLPAAQLIHVSPEMTDFVVSASTAVPSGLALGLEDAPAASGLVVFGKPVWGTDAGPERSGEPVRIDGLLWGPVRLPRPDVPWFSPDSFDSDHVLHGVTAALFRMIDPNDPRDELIDLATNGRITWVPLGRTDWPWGDRLDQKPSLELPNKSPNQWASMVEDRRLLAALWATLNQKRLIDTETVLPYRQQSRRLERAGHTGRDETVHIIHLRHTEYRVLPDAEGDGRKVTVRFPVRSFIRRQPCGPGRSQRKIIVVPAHWKGPEGAPVVHAERIWSLDR